MSAPLTAPARPTALRVQPEGIPQELIDLNRWVVWKYGWTGTTWTKEPLQSLHPTRHASTANPATWNTFAATLRTYEKGNVDGIGFVITPEDNFIGGDNDHCIDPTTGQIDEAASATLSHVPTYWEVSASGHGLHFFARGTFPGGGRKEGPHELYKSGRFFTVTGHHVAATPTAIRAVQPEIDALYAAWFPPKAPRKDIHAGGVPAAPVDGAWWTDDEIIEIAHRAQDGAKFDRLMAGNATDYPHPSTGQPDLSRADGGLAAILHFYCRGDVDQVERIMRGSGLLRDKWDRVIPAYGTSYIRHTIATVPSSGTFYAYAPVRVKVGAPPPAEIDEPPADTEPSLACVAELDQAKARIAELEHLLTLTCADRDRFKLERDAALETHQAYLAVLRNPEIKAVATSALALNSIVGSAMTRGKVLDDGFVPISLAEVGALAGRGAKATASRSIENLETWGFLDRQIRTLPAGSVSTWTGEIFDTPRSELRVRFTLPPADFLRELATFTPPPAIDPTTSRELASWGGKRCPLHPNAPVIEFRVHECGVCHRELAREKVATIAPEADDATIMDDGPPSFQDCIDTPAWISTLRVENETTAPPRAPDPVPVPSFQDFTAAFQIGDLVDVVDGADSVLKRCLVTDILPPMKKKGHPLPPSFRLDDGTIQPIEWLRMAPS